MCFEISMGDIKPVNTEREDTENCIPSNLLAPFVFSIMSTLLEEDKFSIKCVAAVKNFPNETLMKQVTNKITERFSCKKRDESLVLAGFDFLRLSKFPFKLEERHSSS